METVKEKIEKLVDDELEQLYQETRYRHMNDLEYGRYCALNDVRRWGDEVFDGVTIATDTNVGDKWVKTSERKPTKEDADRDERVLAWNSIKKYVFTPTWYYVNLRTDIFTHWMPMIKPPKGVQ